MIIIAIITSLPVLVTFKITSLRESLFPNVALPLTYNLIIYSTSTYVCDMHVHKD